MKIGLCAGLVVSTFSKPLALILGLLVVGVQVSSSFPTLMSPEEASKRVETKGKKLTKEAVGTKLRNPHHSLQPPPKIHHKRRPALRSTR